MAPLRVETLSGPCRGHGAAISELGARTAANKLSPKFQGPLGTQEEGGRGASSGGAIPNREFDMVHLGFSWGARAALLGTPSDTATKTKRLR
eukprot:8122235-Pyramimonas_sp.AAC.1